MGGHHWFGPPTAMGHHVGPSRTGGCWGVPFGGCPRWVTGVTRWDSTLQGGLGGTSTHPPPTIGTVTRWWVLRGGPEGVQAGLNPGDGFGGPHHLSPPSTPVQPPSPPRRSRRSWGAGRQGRAAGAPPGRTPAPPARGRPRPPRTPKSSACEKPPASPCAPTRPPRPPGAARPTTKVRAGDASPEPPHGFLGAPSQSPHSAWPQGRVTSPRVTTSPSPSWRSPRARSHRHRHRWGGYFFGGGGGQRGDGDPPEVSPPNFWQAPLTHSLGTGEETVSKAKQSRSEKKARKVGWDPPGKMGVPHGDWGVPEWVWGSPIGLGAPWRGLRVPHDISIPGLGGKMGWGD